MSDHKTNFSNCGLLKQSFHSRKKSRRGRYAPAVDLRALIRAEVVKKVDVSPMAELKKCWRGC